jgi:serine/threonine-protein kinase RsbW
MADKRFVLSLSNRMTELEKLTRFVEQSGERLCLPDKCMFEINLALEEVFSNIVHYAFNDKRKHTVKVAINARKGKLSLSIEDDGRPFNPLLEAPPRPKRGVEDCDVGGLGIHLIRRLMDDVRYARRANRNELTLIRNRRNHPTPVCAA